MYTTSRDAMPDLASLEICVSIIEGRDLVIKDKNRFSKGGSSDPYVKFYFDGKKIGHTQTIKKNLNPKWNKSFKLKLKQAEANRIVRGNACKLEFRVNDEDAFGDDPMGTVTLPLPFKEPSSTKWYKIGQGEGSHHCKKAKGELSLKISVIAKKVLSMIPGHSLPISGGHIRIGLGWEMEYGRHVDLDTSCVAVSSTGQILMDETVYYGDLVNSNASIRHSGDETTGAGNIQGSDDDERIDMYLDHVSPRVSALYLILTVSTSGKTLADIRSAIVRITDMGSHTSLGNFIPSLVGGHTALFLVRISRSQNQQRGWAFTIIGETDATARDFGSLIPEIKGYSRDIVPNIKIDKNERIAIMRKGGTIRLKDYTLNKSDPATVTLGLAWDVTNGKNVDLDASAICLDSSMNVIDLVYFKNLKSRDGYILHHGDEREGDEIGDDEKITVYLERVHPSMSHIGFVVTSYSGQELDDVKKASCHLFDSNTNVDIAEYKLSNTKELDKHTGVVMGVLSRDKTYGWSFRIISLPAQGKIAKQLVPALQENLARFSTLTPTIPPEPEIIVNIMPQHVAFAEDDIIVNPSQFTQTNQPPRTHQMPQSNQDAPYNQVPPYDQAAPNKQALPYNQASPYNPAVPNNQAAPYKQAPTYNQISQ